MDLDPPRMSHPEDTLDLDVQRLLDDPYYMPLHTLPELQEGQQDFKKARKYHELSDVPHHVRYPPPSSAAEDMANWC